MCEQKIFQILLYDYQAFMSTFRSSVVEFFNSALCIRPCSHESGHFWNRIFSIRIRVDGDLNHCGERLQKIRALLVSEFTGSFKTVYMRFQNYPDSCRRSQKEKEYT